MKRNININKPEMSSEQIAARRNFGTLQQAYQAGGGGANSGLFSKTIYLASGAILVAVGLTIWYFSSGNNPLKMGERIRMLTFQDKFSNTIDSGCISINDLGLSVYDLSQVRFDIKLIQMVG